MRGRGRWEGGREGETGRGREVEGEERERGERNREGWVGEGVGKEGEGRLDREGRWEGRSGRWEREKKGIRRWEGREGVSEGGAWLKGVVRGRQHLDNVREG